MTAKKQHTTLSTSAASAAHQVVVDDFTTPEIAQHLAATLQLILEAEAQWPALVHLVGNERSGNVGKLIARLDPALRGLFQALTPLPGEAPAITETKTKLAAIFNTALGDADQGADPAVFEVDLMERRLNRIEAEQKIIGALDTLRQKLADDVLNTGSLVIEPGLKALDLAKSVAASKPEFHSLLAGVIDALSDMTKAARAALKLARQTPVTPQAATPQPTPAAGQNPASK